jgi:hypothetical protein
MRRAFTLFCGACMLATAALAAASTGPADSFRASSERAICASNYDYAGAQDARPRSGVRAKLRALAQPRVAAGHVAGWLGVGGPGRGPNGTTEWLQAGYSAMFDWPQQIYYEVTLPTQATRYHTVKAALSPGETHVLTVAEVKGKRSTWQVLLDGRTVSPEITLPGSHNRFAPQVLAETWNAGTRKCNDYSYSFRDIRMALAPGGSWRLPKAGYVWRNRHNQAVKVSRDAFVARSTSLHTAAGDDVPPALGPLASRLAGRRLTAECARQVPFVRERPTGHLLLAKRVCEILLGYTVAQPWAPSAESRPGHIVAATALGYLRGVARAARVQAAAIDCRAVGWLSRAMRVLGATPGDAIALRSSLLRHRDRLESKLNFQPGCRFR